MPTFTHIVSVAVGLATLASASPAQPKLNERALEWYEMSRRQAAASPLTDIDILQLYVPMSRLIEQQLTSISALTAEHLETAFYSQGFANFTEEEFLAAGLTEDDITNLQAVGQTEAVHVTTLQNAIQGAGTTPVQACTYNFGFTTAQAMIATASVLENIGVSA